MPEVVRVSQVIDLSIEESLRDARYVEEKRQCDQEIHANDSRHQHLYMDEITTNVCFFG